MSIHFISYGDEKFKDSRERICKEAENTGWFSTITCYTNNDYSLDFYNKNKEILNLKLGEKGGGFMIWKPYFVKKKLDEIDFKDFLIFLDAGSTINNNGKKRFEEYLNIVSENETGILSFKYTNDYFLEKKWTINEIFYYFNVENNNEIIDTYQILSGLQIIPKKQKSIEIINKWYETVKINPYLFTNYYNKNQNKSYFKDNRHDQSILSIIKKIYKCPIINADEFEFKHSRFPFYASRIRK